MLETKVTKEIPKGALVQIIADGRLIYEQKIPDNETAKLVVTIIGKPLEKSDSDTIFA